MPKSKREKVVPLSKVKGKGNKIKEKLVQQLRECADTYANIFVFRVENMRNTKLKELRNVWVGSKFFFGKNKVMVHALGRTPEEEHKDNIYKLSRRIAGECGVLFTNKSKDDVSKFFETFTEPNFARSGCVANADFMIKKGPLDFSFSMETHLRNMGLQTKLTDGTVELLADTVVCTKGDELTPEQCKILEAFKVQMADFRIVLDSWWHGGEFEMLVEDEDEDDMEDDE